MSGLQRVTFHHVYPPYYPGDVAGLGYALASSLRDRRIVSFDDPVAAPDFAAMDRAELVAYGRAHLGLVDEPPADVSDDEIRTALQGAGAADPVLPGASSGWDSLDVMDRVHLEAFARVKCRMGEIDPELTDDELRGQIRAVAAQSLSAGAIVVAPEPAATKRRGR